MMLIAPCVVFGCVDSVPRAISASESRILGGCDLRTADPSRRNQIYSRLAIG